MVEVKCASRLPAIFGLSIASKFWNQPACISMTARSLRRLTVGILDQTEWSENCFDEDTFEIEPS
jgi:hypothetical protein